jgi:hypothetical protein
MGHAQKQKEPAEPGQLKGWQAIAGYLGQPVAVVQRWAKSGMPVNREGRRVYAWPRELTTWLGRENRGEPVHVATGQAEDLSAELKRGLAYFRAQRKAGKSAKAA